MRRWAKWGGKGPHPLAVAILTYRKYVPVAALRPPSLKAARYALEGGV